MKSGVSSSIVFLAVFGFAYLAANAEKFPDFVYESFTEEDSTEDEERLERVNFASTGNDTCMDVFSKRCPFWADTRNYCSHSTYKSWMEKHCMKSCNNCRQCKDTSTSCPDWARKGYCHNPHNFADYSGKCPVSCNMCTPTVSITNCKDRFPKKNQCPYWAQLDYCHSWSDFMRYNCRKSCLYCNDCTDHYPAGACSFFKTQGICELSQGVVNGEMDAHCRKTCDLCPPKTPTAT